MTGIQFPAEAGIFFSSSYPDRLWGSRNNLSKGYQFF